MEGDQRMEWPRWRGLEGLAGLEGVEGAKEGRQADAEARAALSESDVRHVDDEWQLANGRALAASLGMAASLGIVRGAPMSVLQADGGMCNAEHDDRNCAATVIAFELRLRGFDVTAKPYDNAPGSVSFQLGEDIRTAWLNRKGRMPQFTALLDVGSGNLPRRLEVATPGIGSRYIVGVNYHENRGHVLSAFRTKGRLVLFDPQTGRFVSPQVLFEKADPNDSVEVLRVDRLLVRPDIVGAVLREV